MRVGARSSIALRGFDPAPSTVSHSRFAERATRRRRHVWGSPSARMPPVDPPGGSNLRAPYRRPGSPSTISPRFPQVPPIATKALIRGRECTFRIEARRRPEVPCWAPPRTGRGWRRVRSWPSTPIRRSGRAARRSRVAAGRPDLSRCAETELRSHDDGEGYPTEGGRRRSVLSGRPGPGPRRQ